MVFGYIPIQLKQKLFVFMFQAGGNCARIIQIDRIRNLYYFIQFGLADKDFVYGARTDRSTVEQVGPFEFFIREEEKQLVLDDGSTEGNAIAIFIEGATLDFVALECVAAQTVTCVVVKRRPEKRIPAGFGHCVNVTGGKATVFHVERCQFN